MNLLVEERLKEATDLIYSIASKYKDYYNIDDLFQAGCIGVIKANNSYKESYNTKFSTYAYKYILGEIIDFIRKDRNIIISDETFLIYKKYLKVKELLTSKYEREITFKEICDYIKIDEIKMLNIIESVSQAKSISDEENNYYKDTTENIDNSLLIKSELEELNNFDRSLIDYRYFQGYSQSETAEIMGLSQTKVSRCEKLILKRMKENIA